MPTAEARIATDRASRYLAQLCRHLGQMSRMSHQKLISHRPPIGHGEGRMMPAVQQVDYSDTHGTVLFAGGQWTLAATADTLTLRIDADDEEALRRLQDGITARIEKIGRRDGLQVHWHTNDADPQPPAGREAGNGAPSATRDRGHRRTTVGLVAGAALVVALHVGIGGAALAHAQWTGWTANTVLVLVLAKLLFMGGHLFLGRTALRRGIASRRRRKHDEHAGADATG